MFTTLGAQLRKPSGFFGKMVSKMMDTRNRKYYEKMITELDVKKDEKLYEIGYGPGLGICMIMNSGVACTIDGIDFSDLMYHTATKRNLKFINRGTVNLKYGNLLTADINCKTYDKVFCLNVIYFWDDLNIMFKKIHAMLKDGGIYYVFMDHEKKLNKLKFAQNFCKYTIEEVESALRKAGFGSIEYKMYYGYYIKAKKDF